MTLRQMARTTITAVAMTVALAACRGRENAPGGTTSSGGMGADTLGPRGTTTDTGGLGAPYGDTTRRDTTRRDTTRGMRRGARRGRTY